MLLRFFEVPWTGECRAVKQQGMMPASRPASAAAVAVLNGDSQKPQTVKPEVESDCDSAHHAANLFEACVAVGNMCGMR
jgi:hypothetical protein